MILGQISGELVRATSALLGGRTVNIMDLNGVIIASSDSGRIGTTHAGAIEALRTGKMVQINSDNVKDYPGSKVGCNLPLCVGSTVYGVVGIYGNPEEISDTAHLFELYVSKYIEAETSAYRRSADNDRRCRLFHILMSSPDADRVQADSLSGELGLRLIPPFYLAIVSFNQHGTDENETQKNLHGLIEKLEHTGVLDMRKDLCCITDQQIMILAGKNDDRWISLRGGLSMLADQREDIKITIGETFTEFSELRRVYNEANILHTCVQSGTHDVMEPAKRCCMLIRESADFADRYLSMLLDRAQSRISREDFEELLETAASYYLKERSVKKAAELLFIHKNTLQYRLGRLERLLGLENESDFNRELLLRLILQKSRGLCLGEDIGVSPVSPKKEK